MVTLDWMKDLIKTFDSRAGMTGRADSTTTAFDHNDSEIEDPLYEHSWRALNKGRVGCRRVRVVTLRHESVHV